MISTGLFPFIGPSGVQAHPYTISSGARVSSGASLDAYGVLFLQGIVGSASPAPAVLCKKVGRFHHAKNFASDAT